MRITVSVWRRPRQSPGTNSAPTYVGEAEGPGQRRDQLLESNELFVPGHVPLPAFYPPPGPRHAALVPGKLRYCSCWWLNG